jgi:hypothetical protein
MSTVVNSTVRHETDFNAGVPAQLETGRGDLDRLRKQASTLTNRPLTTRECRSDLRYTLELNNLMTFVLSQGEKKDAGSHRR